MEGTRTSLWLLLLLTQLPFCPTEADQYLSTTEPYSSPVTELSLTTIDRTNFPDTDTKVTRGDCLIDTEMGLIAVGSAGGLIVCLLVSTVVLACQVCRIKRRAPPPPTSRSNMNLVSSAGYWGTDQPEVQGLVGPCDASVMLEEVRADSKIEEDGQAEIRKAGGEVRGGLEEGATARSSDPEKTACHLPSSISRDSCLVVPKDLEDMPLVV